MVRTYKHVAFKNTRLYLIYSLVFFLLLGCDHPNQKIALVWKDNRAVAIHIPKALISGETKLQVILSGKTQEVLGNYKTKGDLMVFEPLIPLSPGLSYNILQDSKLIGNIIVPIGKSYPPILVAIYPQVDTLPENTLKFYLRFSKPMRTGQSLDHIYLLDKNKDTMRNEFLNLQPELWDTSGKVLTIWLDPGRIKRDLVLNRKLGNPLKKSETYELVIAQQWKDNRGVSLTKSYIKQFITGARAAHIIDISGWQLSIPKACTTAPLIINTKQPLDHYLLQESITVINTSGATVKGNIIVSGKDRLWAFTPISTWQSGKYKLKVKANLEDLAGNNLNRIFDRDITKEINLNKDFELRDLEIK